MIRSLSLIALLIGLSAPASGQVINAPPGTYEFTAQTPITITYGPDSITFSWGIAPGPNPGPTPGPTPGPAPGPVPPPTPPPVPPSPVVTGHIWIVAIYEYDDLHKLPDAQRSIRTSTTLGASLALLDTSVRNYDKDNPAIASYVTYVKGPLPCYFAVTKGPDGKGKLEVKDQPLPADEASLIAAVKKLRGAA